MDKSYSGIPFSSHKMATVTDLSSPQRKHGASFEWIIEEKEKENNGFYFEKIWTWCIGVRGDISYIHYCAITFSNENVSYIWQRKHWKHLNGISNFMALLENVFSNAQPSIFLCSFSIFIENENRKSLNQTCSSLFSYLSFSHNMLSHVHALVLVECSPFLLFKIRPSLILWEFMVLFPCSWCSCLKF